MKIRLSQVRAIPVSSPPQSAKENDLYLDDGTNTGSGRPGWRIYIDGEWKDVGAVGVEDIKIDGGTF